MGSVPSQQIKNINLQTTPIYCMGFSSDIHFAAEDQSTNQVLTKLKEYGEGQLFKYRIREQQVLEYFWKDAQGGVIVKPWKNTNTVLGILSISSRWKPKTQNIMMLLRKELKIDEKDSIFLYQGGKLCQNNQLICPQQQSSSPPHGLIVLHYSNMEISG